MLAVTMGACQRPLDSFRSGIRAYSPEPLIAILDASEPAWIRSNLIERPHELQHAGGAVDFLLRIRRVGVAGEQVLEMRRVDDGVVHEHEAELRSELLLGGEGKRHDRHVSNAKWLWKAEERSSVLKVPLLALSAFDESVIAHSISVKL